MEEESASSEKTVTKQVGHLKDAPPVRLLQDISNGNDKPEPIPHLEDVVRIIIRWSERNYRT